MEVSSTQKNSPREGKHSLGYMHDYTLGIFVPRIEVAVIIVQFL